VPAILEWPARIPRPRTTDLRCNTSDIHPTLLDIAGVEIEEPPPLDGVSLLPLIREEPMPPNRTMGFWDTPAKGIMTPSAAWMKELLTAQKAGGDLPPNEASRQAATLPEPPHPLDSFPGHAAWIAGDWKLHRIQNDTGRVNWELYDLATDPKEQHDFSGSEPDRLAPLQTDLEDWLGSVVKSFNGEDYGTDTN
jgi:arylsulfatase A-like enzyme